MRRLLVLIGLTAIVVALLAAASGVTTSAQVISAPGPSTPPTSGAKVPTLQSPFLGVSAIVEADVVEIRYDYSDALGPRTVSILANATFHRGQVSEKLEVSQLGGPLPDGTFVRVSEFPILHKGSRYIFFFGPSRWFYTPIWGELLFKVEHLPDRDLILGPDGRHVTGIDSSGFLLGASFDVDPAKDTDPNHPSPSLAATAVDTRDAMARTDFIERAAQATLEAGGAFGTAHLSATPRSAWGLQPTTPPQ